MQRESEERVDEEGFEEIPEIDEEPEENLNEMEKPDSEIPDMPESEKHIDHKNRQRRNRHETLGRKIYEGREPVSTQFLMNPSPSIRNFTDRISQAASPM